jgi:hypothetical protein
MISQQHSPPVSVPKAPEVSKQVEIRAQIDTETVKALLLLNGGGAIALLSLFAAIVGKAGIEKLLAPIALQGVLVFMIGLACAVVHNRLRRICSLHYERHGMRPPRGRFLGFSLRQPTVCWASVRLLYFSLLSFVGAGIYVAVRAIYILG